MRVAIIGDRSGCDYYSIGGVENFMRRIALQITVAGHSVEMFFLDSREQRRSQIDNSLILNYVKEDFRCIFTVLQSYDVVLPAYLSFRRRLFFLLLVFLLGVRGKIFKVLFNWQDSSFKRLIYFTEANFIARNIICISQRQVDFLTSIVKLLPSCVTKYAPPVPPSYFASTEGKINRLDPGNIKLGFIGRLDRGKGIDQVVQVMNYFSKKGGYECSIYGIRFPDDQYGESIHNMLCKQSNVRYVPIERSKYDPSLEHQVGVVLRETDIFLQPYKAISSTVDAPLLVYEAMAALCTIISRNVGDLRRILASDRFLIEEMDDEAFVQCLIEMIEGLSVDDLSSEADRLSALNGEAVDSSFVNVLFPIEQSR